MQADGAIIYAAGNPALYPLEYYDPESGTYQGSIPEFLAQFAREHGYDLRYLAPGPEDRRADLADSLQVDLISGSLTGEAYAHTAGEPIVLFSGESGGRGVAAAGEAAGGGVGFMTFGRGCLTKVYAFPRGRAARKGCAKIRFSAQPRKNFASHLPLPPDLALSLRSARRAPGGKAAALPAKRCSASGKKRRHFPGKHAGLFPKPPMPYGTIRQDLFLPPLADAPEPAEDFAQVLPPHAAPPALFGRGGAAHPGQRPVADADRGGASFLPAGSPLKT